MTMATSESKKPCQFYLKKKNRFCRFAPKPNSTYCPEHACIMGVQEDRKRIPCPLNPNHNCYEDELQRHLKRCNVTKYRQALEKLPYYVKDINFGSKDDSSNSVPSTLGSVRDLTSDKLGAMIAKVNKLYSECVANIVKLYLEHPRIKEEIVGNVNLDLTTSFGDQAMLRKEMLQQASLIGQLDDLCCLSSGHCYVELGAGKGKLSHWIRKASVDCVDNSYVLVERSSVRYKVDSYHKEDKGKEGTFQRIKIDIQDLCLGRVPGIQRKESVVVVGKHLCGGATDLGIRCAVNTLSPSYDTSSKPTQTSHLKDPMSEKTISPSESQETTCADPSNASGKSSSVERSATISERERVTSKGDYSQNEPNICSESSSQNVEECKETRGHTSEGESDVKNGEDLGMEPPAKMARLQEDEVCKSKLQGIMIALCCHHRCTWDTYVGQEFMRQHRINEEEFDLLTRLSSWATCARTRIRGKTPNKKSIDGEKVVGSTEEESKGATVDASGNGNEKLLEVEEEEHSVEDLIGAGLDGSVSLREQLSVSEREVIGRKSKRIIDAGRIDYLQSKNLNCSLREYICEDITPENIVLIATVPKPAKIKQ